MLWLAQAIMVRPNFDATYSSVVIAVPKEHGCQKVEDYRAASVQMKLLSAEADSGCGVDGVSVWRGAGVLIPSICSSVTGRVRW